MSAASARVAVVTGGASGLGLSAVRKLLARGDRVAIWDRNADDLSKAKQSFGSDALLTCEVYISSPAAVAAAAEQTREALGAPDILIAAAGAPGPVRPFMEWTLEDWKLVLDVNLTGAHLTCQALIPAMISSEWGRVVIVSSVAGKEGNALQCGYSAAKAGVIGYVKCLGKELATSGVLVNGIAPTVFDTPMLHRTSAAGPAMIAAMKAKVPMGRLGQPDEFGEMAAWICSDACSFTTGTTFDLSGGRTTY
jgi:3-oxoacyl-[acyl-carrier protein] reductase